MSGAPEDKKQGQGQANLNTIYEEFDLGDRIKALKGKHIKIKKLVKKEDGNYSIRESSLYGEKSVDVSGLSPALGAGADFGYTGSSNILPQENMLGSWSSQIQERTSPILGGHSGLGLASGADSSASNLFAKKNYDSRHFALNGTASEPTHPMNTFKKEPVMVSSGAFNFASQSPGSRIEPFV